MTEPRVARVTEIIAGSPKGFEEALHKIRCRDFCSIHPDPRKSFTPFWGRRFCGLSSLVWRVKDLVEKMRILG